MKTGRYYMDRVLPEAAAHLAKVKTGADAMMALDEASF
ncbi:MAG: acyl-CoA dehydrogenase C-terminal domain-containing protein [Pseudomonadota bacterium]